MMQASMCQDESPACPHPNLPTQIHPTTRLTDDIRQRPYGGGPTPQAAGAQAAKHRIGRFRAALLIKSRESQSCRISKISLGRRVERF